jgi:hypothetical protein
MLSLAKIPSTVQQYLEANYAYSVYLDTSQSVRLYWNFDDVSERLDIAVDAPTAGRTHLCSFQQLVHALDL